MQKTYEAQGLTILAIDVDRDHADADRFLKIFHPDFEIRFDPQGRWAEEFKVSGMPTSVIIDRHGVVRFTPRRILARTGRCQRPRNPEVARRALGQCVGNHHENQTPRYGFDPRQRCCCRGGLQFWAPSPGSGMYCPGPTCDRTGAASMMRSTTTCTSVRKRPSGWSFIRRRRLRVQLKTDPAQLRRRLIAASCALLTTSAARSQEAAVTGFVQDVLKEWQFESALAYYHEDGRIQAVEPVVSASRDYGDGGSIGLNFTFDALSGSSPNGALPSHAPQTFASPSAKSFTTARHLYTTAPGNLPVDPNYSDSRVAVGADWTLPLTRLSRLT